MSIKGLRETKDQKVDLDYNPKFIGGLQDLLRWKENIDSLDIECKIKFMISQNQFAEIQDLGYIIDMSCKISKTVVFLICLSFLSCTAVKTEHHITLDHNIHTDRKGS